MECSFEHDLGATETVLISNNIATGNSTNVAVTLIYNITSPDIEAKVDVISSVQQNVISTHRLLPDVNKLHFVLLPTMGDGTVFLKVTALLSERQFQQFPHNGAFTITDVHWTQIESHTTDKKPG